MSTATKVISPACFTMSPILSDAFGAKTLISSALLLFFVVENLLGVGSGDLKKL